MQAVSTPYKLANSLPGLPLKVNDVHFNTIIHFDSLYHSKHTVQ